MSKYRLNDRVTLQVPTEDYSTGTLVVTDTANQSFWGEIQRIKTPAVENIGLARDYTDGRLRDRDIITIIARYRDTEDVVVGSELTFDSRDGTFSVSDLYDVEYKRYVGIVAERTS